MTGAQGPLRFLEPLDRGVRGGAVLDALAVMIARAGLCVGDRLPPEVQIAHSLGVGRSTIREALNRWEGIGLIRRRQGDGTYIAAPVPDPDGPVPFVVRLEGEAVLRLLEVRRTLEVGVVRLAAERAPPLARREIGRLAATLLEIVAARGSYRAADKLFHQAICDASGNPLFAPMLSRLDQAFERADDSPFNRNAFGRHSFPAHRALADAIIAADPDTAEAACKAIIDSVAGEVRDIIAKGDADRAAGPVTDPAPGAGRDA